MAGTINSASHSFIGTTPASTAQKLYIRRDAEPTGIVTQAPYNQFSHARAFPPADYKTVVRPNVDTLYSSANLDLGPEPVVLSVPRTDRNFMLPLLSLWTRRSRPRF